jgi:hypothetical protein
MSEPQQTITVVASRSEQGIPEPSAFYLGERRIDVVEVLDRWLGTDHGYFKLLTADGIYILRHDDEENLWALTLYKRSESLPGLDVGRKPKIH